MALRFQPARRSRGAVDVLPGAAGLRRALGVEKAVRYLSGSSAATRCRPRRGLPDGGIAVHGVLPYAEELWRCWRARPPSSRSKSRPTRRPRRSSVDNRPKGA